jgi:hypothetical protein
MKMARVILFTGQIDAMSRYYGEVLGLKRVTDEKGWKEFAAGGARIALHSGPSSPGHKGPKIVLYTKDVAAMRETLVARGARFGKVRQGEFCICDGKADSGVALERCENRVIDKPMKPVNDARLRCRRSESSAT